MEEIEQNRANQNRQESRTLILIHLYLNYQYRPNCENGTWVRDRQLYCKDHDKVLCTQWYTIMHIDCNWDEIKTKNDVQQYLDSVKNVIKTTMERAIDLGANEHVMNFDEEFNLYSEMVTQIEASVRSDGYIWF